MWSLLLPLGWLMNSAQALPVQNLTASDWQGAVAKLSAHNAIPAVQQFPNLVVNGGFETGNYTGWFNSGNTSYAYIQTGANFAHSGQYGAEVGPAGTLGYLSQNIATHPGNNYSISIWLNSQGGFPNEFSVTWGGNVLFVQTNIGVTG